MSPGRDRFPATRWLALAGLTLAASLSAALGATEPAIFPTVYFSVFALRPVPGLAVLPGGGHAPQPIELYPTARSPLVSYRGPMPARLVNAVTGATLAMVDIPSNITRALIVLAPATGPSSEGGLTPYVLDETALLSGGTRFTLLNLSGLSLKGRINARSFAIPAGLHRIPAGSGNLRLELHAALKERDYHSYADTFTLAAAERVLLILFPPYYRGSLEVQARVLRGEAPGISPDALPGPSSGGQKRDFGGGARGRD